MTKRVDKDERFYSMMEERMENASCVTKPLRIVSHGMCVLGTLDGNNMEKVVQDALTQFEGKRVELELTVKVMED